MTAVFDIKRKSEALRAEKSLRNLYEIISEYGDTEAAVWLENGEAKSYTYNDYIHITRNYAAYLQAHVKAEPDSYVVIAMDTCKEWFPTFWGVIQAGYNALLADVNLPDEMFTYLIKQAGAKAVISTVKRPLPKSVHFIAASDLFQAPEAQEFQNDTWGDHAALCTSGTTGTSRIFEYNGAAIVEQVLSSELMSQNLPRAAANKNLRSFAFLPYHHVFGFIANLMWSCFLGYCNIYPLNRTPQVLLETAQTFQPHLLITVPLVANNFCTGLQKKIAKESAVTRTMFHVLKAVSLGIQTVFPDLGLKIAEKVFFKSLTSKLLGSNITTIILGGSYTPMEHLKLLSAIGYYTVCGFGMTETAITSVETSMNLHKRISGSVGKPLSNVEYRVKPSDGHGRRGEMFIRGKSLHTGRLVDGKRLPPDTIEGGWYPTGDVVRLERGDRMFVEGRVKDVIINESGENVYPDELDNIFSAMSGVEQSTVLGVLKPGKNQKYEDIVLVMNVGAAYRDDAYLETLMAEINARNAKLPTLKRLSRVIVTPEPLPLVNSIKVKRFALKAMIEENKLAYRDLRMNASKAVVITEAPKEVVAREVQPSDLQLEEIKQKVRALYAEALDMEENSFTDEQHFIDDLEGDSLQVLSAALKTEEQFSITIPVEEYGQCTTVNDMSALIYGKLNGQTAYESQGQPDEAIQPIEQFEDAPEFIAFQKRMESLSALGGENPYFVCHESPLRDTSLMDGHEVLNFGSYNYAGMSGRPEVVAAAKAAMDKYGTSASGSRLLAGEKELYIELEKELAAWKHTEDALVLVGGHSTNVTFVGNFCDQNDLILYDVLAHNSIEQGCRLSRATSKPFPHNDWDALDRILRAQRDRYAKVLIVIEGAYSMDGDIADVPAFVAVKKKHGCFLMVDEAHSTCVIGETGGGVDEYFGLEPGDVDIKMGTLSKGLGTCGGYLAGSKNLITYLRYNLPGFVFSVGISPPLAAATLQSIRSIRQNPQIMKDMKRNIDTFVAEAGKRNLDICLAGHSAIIPVLVGKDEDAFFLSNKMRENGVFVPPAVYPAVPKNKARLRFCVISEHKPDQIVQALDTLVRLADETGIKLPSPQ